MRKVLLFLFTALMVLSMRGFAQNNCATPTGLAASLHAPEWNNVLLNWNAVVDSTQQDILWSTTTFSTRIGGGDSVALDFTGTVRFTPTELVNLSGHYLTSVSFVPGEDQTICTYYVMVWQGGSVTNDTIFNPGTLLVNQQITSPLAINSMNTILLQSPVLIDPTQELWIGIRCDATTGYPLGASNNTSVFNFGDLIAFNDTDTTWETLSGGDPTAALAAYNWLIIGHLQTANNILSGYKVYRNDVLLATASATSYLDSVDFGSYTYDVTAMYASGCESNPVTVSVTMKTNPCADCQDTVIVEDATTLSTGYLLPLNTFYKYSFSEQLYTTADLGTINGAINCISFQYIYGTPQSKDIVVYMGNTNKSSFAGGNDWVPVNQMFQVFNGTVNFTNVGAGNWVNIPFDVPFEYDGTSNIVVAVLNNTGSYVSSSNPTFNVHSASSKSLYLYTDSSPYNVNSLGSGTLGSARNNLRFMVGDPVTCPMPTYLTVSNITAEGASFSWHSSQSHNGYELVLVPEGSTLENETVITLSDTFYAATALTSNTNYTVYVRADCGGGDNSFWNMQSFKTLCSPTAQLPYVVDMEGVGTGSGHIPDCAEVGVGTGYTSYPYVSGTYHHSGSGALYFYSYSPNSSTIRFQGLDLTDNIEPLVMRFWEYPTSSGYGYVQAGYMTDPSDFSSFVLVKTVYSNEVPASTWTEITVALPEAVNGQVIYPTLYCPFAPGSSSNYFYIDDLVIEAGQTACMAPHNMHFTNVSGSSAQVVWTPDATATGTETYHVEYTEAGTENWQSVTTTASYCLIGGLTQQTLYDVRLYMDCGENGYSDTLTGTLLTHCLSSSEFSIGNGTSTYSYLPSYGFYNYSYTQQIFLSSEMNGPGALTSIAFEASAIATTRTYKIYLMHTTATSADNWLPTDSAVMVYSGNQQMVVGWNTYYFTAPFFYNGTDNLALIVVDETGSYASGNSWMTHTTTGTLAKYIYQDGSPYSINTTPSSGNPGTTSNRNNVRFGGDCDSTATCVAPNAVVTNYSDNEITIAWVPGDQETSWELEYKTADTTDWTSEGTVNVTTYTFTNLASNTEYDIRLRSVCSSSEFSDWTVVSASTVCDYINVPYVQDFESTTGSGSSAYVDCWFRGTNYSTQYPYISTSYASSGSRSLYFYGTSSYYSYAALPRLSDAVTLDSLEVSVNLYATTSGYSIEAGMMTDPYDYSTFVPLKTFTVPVSYMWETYEFTTANYAGNGRYVAFRIPQWGSSYIYLDDLFMDYMAACAHPEDLAVQNALVDEATIGWTPGGDESEWEYTYGLTGTVDLETAAINMAYTNSATVNGLQPNTSYDFYVRASCTGGGESHWRIITFTTDCLPIDLLPYTQNFDSMSTHTSNISSGPNNLADCWNSHNSGTTYTNYPYVYYGSSYSSSGSYSLRFYSYTSSSYADQYAILPALDINTYPIDNLQLTFDARRYSTSYPFCLVIGAMTGTDVSTFTPIDTMIINTGSTTYSTEVFFTSGFTGTGDRLALMAPYNIGAFVPGAYYNEGNIDNLVLSVAPTCPQPTHLTVDNVTEDAVTLSWTENGTAGNWVVEYGPTGFTPGSGTEVQANSNPYTITNLSSVAYDFYVKSDCGAGDESPLTGPVSATPGSYLLPVTGTYTVTTCSMVIYDDGGVDGDYSTNCDATLIIQPSIPGNAISIQGTCNLESSWEYLRIYDGAGTTGTLLGEYSGSFTIPTLTSTTGPLTIHFTSDGSVVYPGFELIVSCVSNTCPPPSSISVSNVGNTTAMVSWTPTGNETSWIVEHKPVTGTNWTTATATTTSYQLTGLTGLTEYQVRVKADCGDETSSYKTTTFTTPNCEASEACSYTFVLGDGYGDGWNNGYLTLEQNGVVEATVEAVNHNLGGEGSVDTVYVVLCDGNSIDLVWHEGGYDDEVSITLLDPDGVQIFTISDLSGITSPTIHTFTTDCGDGPQPEVCETPTGLHTTNLQNESIAIAWDANPDVASWNIQYRQTSGQLSSATSNTNSYTITGLTPGTDYQIQVQAVCTNGLTSEWCTAITASTTDVGIDSWLANSVTLYPNPAKEVVHVQCTMNNAQWDGARVEVLDVYGKLLQTVQMTSETTVLNVSGLADGMYFVRVTTEEGSVTKTFVKR